MLKSPLAGARERHFAYDRFLKFPVPALSRLEDPMKNISVLALGAIIALFSFTRIGAAADSRDNNASVSNPIGNSSGDSFLRLTYAPRIRIDTGVESKEDSKRFLENYKPITLGNSEYASKGRLNPLTLYNW
jgi:hypothetical protein